MSKKSDEDERPLGERLSEWLRTQGYPLELKVAAAFRSAGFWTFQSEFYKDPETNDFREIDVVATKEVEGHRQAMVRVTFVVECKASTKHPWVLFLPAAGSVLTPEHRYLFTIGSKLAKRALISIRRRPDAHRLALFTTKERPAYGLTQAFTSGKDVTYAAATGVINAAIARARTADSDSEVEPILEIVIPVVVVQGKLFEYTLGDSGEDVTAEVGRGLVVWRKPTAGRDLTVVHIVAADSLAEFVKDALEAADFFLTSSTTEVEKVSNQWWRHYEESQNSGPLLPGP